jgi:hypothetical protein
MPQLFANNARALLASGINDTSTSLTVEAGRADSFPTANVGNNPLPSANNWFKATLQDTLGNVEIIYVRTRAAGSAVFSNVLRAQEGTVARSFTAGAIVGLRLTALDVQQSINILSNSNVFSAPNTFAANCNFTTGLTIGSSWNFTETVGGLIIRHNGVAVAKIESNGNLTSVGTLRAGGTV